MKRRSFLKNLLFGSMLPVALALGVELITKTKIIKLTGTSMITVEITNLSDGSNGGFIVPRQFLKRLLANNKFVVNNAQDFELDSMK